MQLLAGRLHQFDALNRMERVGPDANADGNMDSVFSLSAYDPQSRLTAINRAPASLGSVLKSSA